MLENYKLYYEELTRKVEPKISDGFWQTWLVIDRMIVLLKAKAQEAWNDEWTPQN